MYPPEFSTRVDVGLLARELCGASGKNFINEIMVVLIKLVMQVKVHYMTSGRIIKIVFLARRLFRDWDTDVNVLQGDTVRSWGGLALSSGHKYLSGADPGQLSVWGCSGVFWGVTVA
ncbi:MAG: pantoate--beta-alanine ligase [Anaplasma sp.]